MQEKKKLRAQMKAFSESIDWASVSEKIIRQLNRFSFCRNSIIAGYWPQKDELNIIPFLEKWGREGGSCCLPVVESKGMPLLFRRWTPTSSLIEGAYGIAIPSSDEPLADPSILLIPGLAMDQKGYRLGHGGGYYDRTLAKLRMHHSVQAIGVISSSQVVFSLPCEKIDQRLDIIVTEEIILSFSDSGHIQV